MASDPFFDEIVQRLGRRLDPEVFERCATDLLRTIWPGLAPIPGGSDSGMDGAVADGEGPAFPLVATTHKRPIENLTQSLRSYVKDGGKRRKVILATSQTLTPRRRRNLEKTAESRGFELVQVYERTGIADLLYRDSRWCKELLGLAGDPTALSVVPRSTRPYFAGAAIGRKDDLAWLENTKGDRLLVGQPGSGKTFLLRLLTQRGHALFVASDDRAEIAAAIRAQQPLVLLVDDAHAATERLTNLMHLRSSTGAKFEIVATCWPGERSGVRDTLVLPEKQVRELAPMPRVQIGEIVRAVAPRFADWVVGEIVDQAEGRPGLAATLTHLCQVGDFVRVLKGEALADSIRHSLQPLVGAPAIDYLACFALCGDSGCPLDAVAAYLKKAPADLRADVVRLAAAGVILEVPFEALSVRPPALRAVLVRDVFFETPVPLDCRPLVEAAPSRDEVCKTLVASARAGAVNAHALIRELLTGSTYCSAWKEYAWLDRDTARWVFDNRRGAVTDIAGPLLHHVPDAAITQMLHEAVGDERELHSHTDHPLRKLSDWVKAARPGTQDAVARRRALVLAAQRWLESGGDAKVGMKALVPAFSIVFQAGKSDPVDYRKYYVESAFLTADDLTQTLGLWPEVAGALRGIHVGDWRPLLDILHEWAFPHALGMARLADAAENVVREGAAMMARDLAQLARDRPGVLANLRETARQAELAIELPSDPEFEVLFPTVDWRGDYDAQMQDRAEAARALAARWSHEDPNAVAARLRRYEVDAKATNDAWPHLSAQVCEHIAAQTRNAAEWYAALRNAACGAEVLFPFLRRMALSEAPDWEAAVGGALDNAALRAMAVELVLTLPNAPEALLGQAMAGLDGLAKHVGTLCSRGVVSEAVTRRLLQHPDGKIAGAAAYGEWHADPKASVRESLRNAWRGAVIRADGQGHELLTILPHDSELAFEWLQNYLVRDPMETRQSHYTVETAVKVLSLDQRRALLPRLGCAKPIDELVQLLIGRDSELYRQFLGMQDLKRHHLVPLEGHPDPQWTGLALEALSAGHQPQEIVDAAFGTGWSWSGEESDMWQGWIDAFEALGQHKDERLQVIARDGAERARRMRDDALKRERDEAVYGR